MSKYKAEHFWQRLAGSVWSTRFNTLDEAVAALQRDRGWSAVTLYETVEERERYTERCWWAYPVPLEQLNGEHETGFRIVAVDERDFSRTPMTRTAAAHVLSKLAESAERGATRHSLGQLEIEALRTAARVLGSS